MRLTKRLNQLVKYVTLLWLLCLSFGLSAQDPDLYTCYRQADRLSPLKQQELYLSSINTLSQQVEANKHLPDLSLRAMATYQSDVFSIPFSMPGADIPVIPKDQYQLSLSITQNLYDGGVVKASKDLKQAESEVRQQQLSVLLYGIRSVINELFFGILSLQASELVILQLLDELTNRERSIRSGVENGTLLPGALKSIKKEQLFSEQQLQEVRIRKNALSRVLGEWTGMKITGLTLPDPELQVKPIPRPELALFERQEHQIMVNKKLITSTNKPRLMAFANAGYGSPNSLNFFETDWNSWYLIGGRLEWKFWDWNSVRKQQQIFSIHQDILHSEQEQFERQVSDQLIRQQAEIELMKQSIQTDRQLVRLQEEITETAARQLDLGTISATEYLTELNQLAQARLQMEQHQIALAKAQITYLTLSGNNL